ncbi:GNAT family acetyltransferase [Scardovia inopinata]|uniref:N-acetyltransferase domain-containing protein n=2 Tax=Scardovia inopinata TaxID=78259 RepID=W5IIR3_SCAIO|nr:hypothetical protein HMPREF9020_00389 [Scardovia inopinata F0304]SUV51882.1 GNAT family acetyltransferase [Scardovia inopinata]
MQNGQSDNRHNGRSEQTMRTAQALDRPVIDSISLPTAFASPITLRSLRETDIDRLAAITQKAWFKPRIPSSLVNGHRADEGWQDAQGHRRFFAAKYDFLWYLNKCTHALVADIAGRVSGVILTDLFAGHEDGIQALSGQDRLFEQYDKWIKTAVPDGSKIATSIQEDDLKTNHLAEAVRRDSQAEIVLFIVDDTVRGQGVGKTLWQAMIQFLSTHGVDNYYLYTDTECNFMFYEYQGLTRVTEQLNASGPVGEPLDKFIYQGSAGEPRLRKNFQPENSQQEK